WHFFPSRRHAVLANLAVILPRAGRRERVKVGKSIVRAYNRMLFEFFRLPHLSREELLAREVGQAEELEEHAAVGPHDRLPDLHTLATSGAGEDHREVGEHGVAPRREEVP